MPSPLDTIPQTTQDFAAYKELLYTIIVANKYQKVLETGTDVGDSTRIFSTALQATQGELVTVDLKPPLNEWPKDWPLKNIRFLTGDSKEIQLQQEIDLLFLDAHSEGTDTYAHVKVELTKLGMWVRVGGKILLDDVFHDKFGEGIRKAYEEFCRTHLLAWTVYPQSHGLAVIEVTHPFPKGGSNAVLR